VAKILVALSGGVDSSTAAALLKERGNEVTGGIINLEGISEEDIFFAQAVCQHLNIPFLSFDFQTEYQRNVIDNFMQEYKSGHTPNPCVLCNKHIKFGLFLQRAIEMGFDKIATGHYVRIEKMDSHYIIKRGKDKNEQSYFLYRLGQNELSKIVFPLGIYTKEEVRSLAKKFSLPTAHRKKSQDVCFVPDSDYATYLKKYISPKPGPILDKNGKNIGAHKGVIFYTYGQRRGIGLSHHHPFYVIKIDAMNNTLYVGEKSDVYKRELIARDINFIHLKWIEKPIRVLAKARYVAALSEAMIEPIDNRIRIMFDKPQWALTPGQSVVFYQNNTLLGGGIIEEVIS